MKFLKENRRHRIHMRIRNKLRGTTVRPRISMFRSNLQIYCQIIDDTKGHTLVSASSKEAAIDRTVNKVEQARQVGRLLAERAKAANIDKVLFDRSGYLYHGRIKALADGAREGGLQF
jgi:large subunit ribosomal protein L18